ncbi:MAG: LysR family transcriptional regulator, partial [Kordiimonas sp.]
MMSGNWEGVIEFVCVVEKGSFSDAAQSLGVSRSHVSKKVKELEVRLGVELLHRTTRSVNLTGLGAEFFPKCKRLLGEMDEAQALLIDEAVKPQGTIRLTVAGAFGERMLAPALAGFAVKYPDISVDVEFTNRLINLSEEQFDLALRSGQKQEIFRGTEKADLLYQYKLLTVASPIYLEKNAPITTIEDLQYHNCLSGTLPHWRFDVSGQVQNTVVHGRWRSNNGRALVAAAIGGGGGFSGAALFLGRGGGEGGRKTVFNRYFVVGGGGFFVFAPQNTPTAGKNRHVDS